MYLGQTVKVIEQKQFQYLFLYCHFEKALSEFQLALAPLIIKLQQRQRHH